MRTHARLALAYLLTVLLLAPSATAQVTGESPADRPKIDPPKAAALVVEPDMKKHLRVLAADDMEGRDTGTPGQAKAAEYIRKHLKEAGLKSLVADGSYFQPWNLRSGPANVSGSTIAWKRKGKAGTLRAGGEKRDERQFEALPMTGQGKITATAIFAGFGITAKEYDYDDYAGIDAKGKIVVVLRHEPREDEDSGWNGRTNTEYASFESKYKNAVDHGAAAIVFITDPVNHEEKKRRPEPSGAPGRGRAVEPNNKEAKDIPAVWADYTALAPALGGDAFLVDQQKKIDRTLKPASLALDDLTMTITLKVEGQDLATKNICSFFEGSDPNLKKEFVVLGAHYDHVGVQPGGGSGDKIFNGAGDNASGTTTLLVVAQALAKSGMRPRRSIAFLHFSGEEKGLLGSEYYVAHPLRPLEDVVAMINMDMVGRAPETGLEIVGTQFSPDLRAVVDAETKAMGMKVEYKSGLDFERVLERSDQAPFYKKKIPIAFFTTGLHKDYHKVTDHWDLIIYPNMESVGRAILRTALVVADAPYRPKFEEAK